MTTPGPLTPGHTWQTLLARTSFIELDALGRATALADKGSVRVLCGPFDRMESPWLEPQGVTPQADDGTVIARARIDGQPVVIASIEQRFLGGGTGEVSGAKISQTLLHAAAETRNGAVAAAVILFETGGVRLQEARIGLNGPEVIEQEGDTAESDASDRALIWAIDGGEQHHATGLADTLVADDVDAIRLIPELGITCAVEVLPGHVLTNLLASAVPSLAGISIENVAHVRTIRANASQSMTADYKPGLDQSAKCEMP
ncbi:MAG: hypothetical protein U0R81_03545 [Mycobacterium sp.]